MFSVQQIKWVFDKIFGKRPTNSNKFNEIGNNNILICKKCVYWNLIDWKLSLNFRRKSVGQIVAMYNNIWCSKNSIKLETREHEKKLNSEWNWIKSVWKSCMFFQKTDDFLPRRFDLQKFQHKTGNKKSVYSNWWKFVKTKLQWQFTRKYLNFSLLFCIFGLVFGRQHVCILMFALKCFDSFALWLRRYFDLKLCLYFELLSVCE